MQNFEEKWMHNNNIWLDKSLLRWCMLVKPSYENLNILINSIAWNGKMVNDGRVELQFE